MGEKQWFAAGVIAAVAFGGQLLAQQPIDRRQLEKIEQTLRHEGQAVVALADAAADNESVPSDFAIEWHNDFLKAQSGTFVPFVVRVAPQKADAALLYVRVARRPAE